jgi:hypothetical protein
MLVMFQQAVIHFLKKNYAKKLSFSLGEAEVLSLAPNVQILHGRA